MDDTRAQHDAPADRPGSRRVGNLSVGLRRAMGVGPLTRAEVAAIGAPVLVAIAVALLPVDWLIAAVVTVALGTVAGSVVAPRVIPHPVRRALEAFGFLGEWELERARAVDAGAMATPDEASRWLATHPERPDDRWLRWEILLLVDQPAEARAVAERMPVSTPYERFERAYALDRVAWRQGAPSDLATLASLAEASGPPDSEDRRHAEVALAVALAKDRVAANDDPLPPLLAAREHLPADVGLGRQYVASLRGLAFIAAVVSAIVVPGALTLIRAILGPTG